MSIYIRVRLVEVNRDPVSEILVYLYHTTLLSKYYLLVSYMMESANVLPLVCAPPTLI
jgi:hypothetical protein